MEVVVQVLEDHPDLAARARLALGLTHNESETFEYLKVKQYAERLKVSERCVEKWLTQGLPVIKVGRVRRIPVRPADRWLRDRSNKDTSALSNRAPMPETVVKPASPAVDIKGLARLNARKSMRRTGK